MAAMDVDLWRDETRRPGDLLEHPRNPRTHSPEQVEQVRRSIREFGFTNPVLIRDDGLIIAGHCRTEAALLEGMDWVPVRVRNPDHALTDSQVLALVVADNRLAENAGWDDKALAGIMADLRAMEFDTAITGFADADIQSIIDGTWRTAPVDQRTEFVPPVMARGRSRLGDVWKLGGGHRVICGDATNADHVAALLRNEKPPLMVTDPPYGVEYDPSWRQRAGVNLNASKLGVVRNDDRADWREAWALFPGDVAYVWHAGRYASVVQASLEVTGFDIRAQIIWAKDRFVLSRGHYHWQHEPCWYAVRETKSGRWAGDRSQSTLWSIPAREDGGHGHGTQKPVECMRRPIINHTNAGESVYDPFLGSGTTLIAAETSGRICYGSEISPAYVDVIIGRWQQLTGNTAVRESDGAAFNDVEELPSPDE